MNVPRFRYDDLIEFGVMLLSEAGLAEERAHVVASVLIEADLLGYSTHGLERLPSNIDWLLEGSTNSHGDVTILARHGTCQTWDANFLPGPWVTTLAINSACNEAQDHGIAAISIRRSQHIACLAAYLTRADNTRLLILLTASSSSDIAVCAHGGVSRIFSCNPLAFWIPTGDRGILVDMSASMLALGPLNRAFKTGKRLSSPCIVMPSGEITDDAAAFTERGGAILPAGGIDQGYKGYALSLLAEALSSALSGYGRADEMDDGEANAVHVQVIDPQHFAGRDAFERQMGWLSEKCRASQVAPNQPSVRIPGDRALALKEQQLRIGLTLQPTILNQLEICARKFQRGLPEPMNNAEL